MFSKACEYALRATIFIAQKSNAAKKLSVDEIAAGIDAPKSFTAKILQQLHRGEVIASTKGPNGGFHLTEEMKNQPVWDVLASFGEEERLTNCVMGLHQCTDKKPCPLHGQYKVVKKQLVEMFKESLIRDMAGKMMKNKAFIKNM